MLLTLPSARFFQPPFKVLPPTGTMHCLLETITSWDQMIDIYSFSLPQAQSKQEVLVAYWP